MLESIQNLSVKSWVNYCGPDGHFSRVNLLFGQNGQGKSALAAGIRSEVIHSVDSAEAVRFFDRDYVQREMSLVETDGIKGVKVDFGKHNTVSESDIENLTTDLHTVETSLNNAREEYESAEASIRQRVDELFTSTKGSSNIRAKKADLSLRELIQAWINDYEKYAPRFPDFDYSSHVADNKIDLIIDVLEDAALQTLPDYDSNSVEDAVAILKRSYKSVDNPAPIVISWIEEGIRLSEELDRCPFCGSTIRRDEILTRVENYQKNEIVSDQRALDEFRNRLDEISSFMTSARSRGLRALPLLPSDSVDSILREWLESDTSDYSRASALIDGKINDMGSVVDVDSNFFEFVCYDLRQAKKLKDTISAEIAEQSKVRDNLTLITRASVGFKISTDRMIADAQVKMREASIQIKGFEDEIRKLDSRIKELKESKIDVSGFAAYLNEVLIDLGLPFTLETHRDGYYLLTLSDNQGERHLTLHDISEGEKNLLALLLFFYTLFTDEDQTTLDGDIQTIIIDDPITSMDNTNRFYVLELLRHITRSGNAQVFIFTHSWDDFCELAYRHPEDTSLFEVIKREGASLLLPCKTSLSPYQKLFKEVYLFSKMKGSDEAFEEIALYMPNTMRRVLEEYLSFNCGVTNIGSSNIQAIGESLFQGKSWNKISQAQKGKLSLLLTVTNLFSHKVGGKHDAATIQKCAIFMMNRIKAVNPRHYSAMKQ